MSKSFPAFLPFLGFLAVALLVAHYPAIFSAFEWVQHDDIDSRFNHFVLEHGYLWLIGERESFWDAQIFYPQPNSLAFGDTLLGLLPFYAVIRLIGVPVELNKPGEGWLWDFVENKIYSWTINILPQPPPL